MRWKFWQSRGDKAPVIPAATPAVAAQPKAESAKVESAKPETESGGLGDLDLRLVWDALLRKKAWITTGVAAILWAIIASIIISGLVTVRDIDMFNRMGPATESGETDA